jgi:uncharacterized protein YebE (UPF0316 family)
MGFDFFSWVVVPMLIFLARVMDVSLGTLRFIFLSRGYRKIAPLLGFVEVLIWVIAVREVMLNLRNIACFLSYGAGFAAGNFVGMWIEEKLSIGMVLLRIVLRNDHSELVDFLKENEYGYTMVDGEGAREKVKILFSILQRKNLNHVLNTLSQTNPQALYAIENIKSAGEGVFPHNEKTIFSKLFRKHRKSK